MNAAALIRRATLKRSCDAGLLLSERREFHGVRDG